LALRKVYKLIAPIYYYMYTDAPDVQIGTYSDLWQKDRYRVELAALLENSNLFNFNDLCKLSE